MVGLLARFGVGCCGRPVVLGFYGRLFARLWVGFVGGLGCFGLAVVNFLAIDVDGCGVWFLISGGGCLGGFAWVWWWVWVLFVLVV